MITNISLLINAEPTEAASGASAILPTLSLAQASSETSEAQQSGSILNLRLETGKTVFLTGPNGVGKSSLLAAIDRLARGQGVNVETFFGSREIRFRSDDVDQLQMSLEQLTLNLREMVTRFHHPFGEEHLKSVMRRLIALEAQAAADVYRAQENGSTFDEAKAAHPLLISLVNGIFETARLPIRIELAAGRLQARRGNANYSINRLSDGERAALLLVGAVLIQPSDTLILIDEPERHLNPAISGALLAALVRARTDLCFVFASHDLHLLEWVHPQQVIHLRNSTVLQSTPEERRYDITLLNDRNSLPEELQFAVLGSRRLLLLVEGETNSEDQALYGHIYPAWNIVARGSWETVANGVKALNGNKNYHWLSTAGIIDRDGRGEVEQANLAADRIFCLPVPMIENLFLHPIVLDQMAFEIAKLKGGQTDVERIEELKNQLPRLFQSSREDVIVKWLVWEANRRNSGQKVSATSVRRGQTEIPRIDLLEIKARLTADYDAIATRPDPMVILSQIPVKNSAIPNRVAKQLGFDDYGDYARSVLKQIEIGSHSGKAIIAALRAIMPQL